jgi:hypothetical protein
MDKEQVSAAPADREALNLDERCRIALECLPDAQYREMLARLLSDLRAAAPAAVPLQPLTIFKQALLAYADEEYCRSLRMYRTDPCLGWEAKVKAGRYGATEHEAHRQASEHMGAHRGIYAAVKFVEASLAVAPTPPGESAGSAPAEPAPAPAMVMLTEEEIKPLTTQATAAWSGSGRDWWLIRAVQHAFAQKNGAAVAPKENNNG